MKKRIALMAVLGALSLYPVTAGATGLAAQIIKNPNCGCCKMHGDYLSAKGFDVTITENDNVPAMARLVGIPDEMQGCHLTMIDGYAISGHVPVETILKLLEERPDIRAITLPGMPMGSPGMGGAKDGPFHIYQIHDGKAEIYDVQ